MTTNPEDGMRALGELEHSHYRGALERAADHLELKLVRNEAEPEHIHIWRDRESTSQFADYTFALPHAGYAFLYGLAVGIQGDWTP